MQTGKIISLQPTAEVGYQSKDPKIGYIYTFNMSVQCPDGVVTGEIGSKTQVYPMKVGDEIKVEVNQTNYGVRLKKITDFKDGKGKTEDNRGYALSYTKDLVVAKIVALTEIFSWADKMVNWLDNKPQVPTPMPQPQQSTPPPDDDVPWENS